VDFEIERFGEWSMDQDEEFSLEQGDIEIVGEMVL
jgi:hypothetical protein